MRGALLEPNLQRVVPGIRGLEHQALEVARELRVLIQQSPQGKGRTAVVRIRFVEARFGRGRCAPGIELGVERVAYSGLKKVAHAAIVIAVPGAVTLSNVVVVMHSL